VLLPLHGKRAMRLVSAHSNSSAVHNYLPAALLPADFALLRPHLRPLVLPSGRTSSVPIGGSSLCVSLRPASRRSWQSNPRREWKSVSSAARGMSGTPVMLGGDQSPHSTYVQVAEQAQQITAQGHDREPIAAQRGDRNSRQWTPGGGHARYFLARLSCRKLLGRPSGICFKRPNKLRVEQ
jgi:hypothetical protein